MWHVRRHSASTELIVLINTLQIEVKSRCTDHADSSDHPISNLSCSLLARNRHNLIKQVAYTNIAATTKGHTKTQAGLCSYLTWVSNTSLCNLSIEFRKFIFTFYIWCSIVSKVYYRVTIVELVFVLLENSYLVLVFPLLTSLCNPSLWETICSKLTFPCITHASFSNLMLCKQCVK